ncbi:Metaxin-like protein [Hapsidospora chrysogenum ATCC 11550]|uniref:Metaxin-like protein n=1 Tax=Hapsidospora chrysogenum (strain ATCC 11550 / CBS 779.69 / DSM 880 / IAM 14645 / JCM 23072 / IMI 49137) TaxID=857340 RepID=A0A086T3B4_HAPC1|nr:Metaxin-like protein [Hapsidospora chrysogenum ATCC 11550]
MLELYAWGPAFGLPSIDPECLAIITHLHKAATPSSWRLIYSNDPSVSPANCLPALNHGGVWTSGYRRIVTYLTTHSLCDELDAGLSPLQKADCLAYSTFLSAHAGPLLDLSLYASAANWSATTRPAYSELLPFPLTWTVPPLIRHEAMKRVEHLGLAELDTDFDPNGALHLSTGRDSLPETFRRHLPVGAKKTVRDEMTPEQATAIRLFSLTEDCLSVLEGLLPAEDADLWLLRPSVSSLDCLAFGYLAIMRDAPVPRAFLRDWMAKKNPRLTEYVDRVKAACLEKPGPLPVSPPEALSILGVGARTFESAILNTPAVGEHYATEVRHRAEQGAKGLDRRALMLAMSAIATGAAVGYGLYFYKTMQPFGARTQVWKAMRGGSKLSEFGDLGFILDSAMGSYPSPAAQPGGVGGSAGPGRLVETDSEVD